MLHNIIFDKYYVKSNIKKKSYDPDLWVQFVFVTEELWVVNLVVLVCLHQKHL